eukprot:gene19221-biopygen23953
MPWWNGSDVQIGEKGTEKVHLDTLKQALNDMVRMPERKNDAPMRGPIELPLACGEDSGRPILQEVRAQHGRSSLVPPGKHLQQGWAFTRYQCQKLANTMFHT